MLKIEECVAMLPVENGDRKAAQMCKFYDCGDFVKARQYADSMTDAAVLETLTDFLSREVEAPFKMMPLAFFVKAPFFVVEQWRRQGLGSFVDVATYAMFRPNWHGDFYVPKSLEGGSAVRVVSAVVKALITDTLEVGEARMMLPRNYCLEFCWQASLADVMRLLMRDHSAFPQFNDYVLAVENALQEGLPAVWDAWQAALADR